MADLKVADVVPNGIDAVGVPILEVYAKDPPSYAVYRTHDRVLVHYADDPSEATAQRTSLVGLNVLRGEINGLIDGWRNDNSPAVKSRAKRYERRVADALIVALEHDSAGALANLTEVKSDIIDERTSTARVWYLLAAVATVAAVALIAWLLGLIPAGVGAKLLAADVNELWIAADAGALGAFFSIASAIRTRTILTDLRMTDNVADAVLRVLIGVIGAIVLICLLKSGAASLSLGAAKISAPGTADPWMTVFVFGFVSGFSERMIPDLLAKVAATPATVATPAPPSGGAGAGAGAGGAAGPGGGGGPGPGGPGGGAGPGAGAAPPPVDPTDAVDACPCDAPAHGDELTGDADLPAATGGVASAA